MNVPLPSPCSFPYCSSSSSPSTLLWLSPQPPVSNSTSLTSCKPNRSFCVLATATIKLSRPPPSKKNGTSLDPLFQISSSPHTYLPKPFSRSTFLPIHSTISHSSSIHHHAPPCLSFCEIRAYPLRFFPHQVHASLWLPAHVKAWSAVVSRLSTESPSESINLFDSLTRRVRRFSDPSIVADSKPYTAAYNAVLNACVNLEDKSKFLKLFDEMSEWSCKPDVLTYNVMIKLCARADRKDLLVFMLERIIEKNTFLYDYFAFSC